MRSSGKAVQSLSLYGAAGIASYGWALGRLLHFSSRPYLPLWAAGALFVYNMDRLKTDPSDAINTPLRKSRCSRLRPVVAGLAALAACALVVLPILARDWIALALTAGGAVVCLGYSVPLLGFRLKDVPLLKTFFAPALVAASYFILPLPRVGMPRHPAYYLLAAGWTSVFLLFNMMLCDLRDVDGDRRMRTLSLPVVIGAAWTLRALVGLLAILGLLTWATASEATRGNAPLWYALGAASVLYLGGLWFGARKPRPEFFYEWWVEGMLFLPCLAVLTAGAITSRWI